MLGSLSQRSAGQMPLFACLLTGRAALATLGLTGEGGITVGLSDVLTREPGGRVILRWLPHTFELRLRQLRA